MDKILLSVPNFSGNELEYVTKAIETEWVSTAGNYITEFENNISSYVKSQGAVACQSGTAGLHLALQVCGVKNDTEVIVPTLTFIAAVNPVKYLSAEPVFMDCDDTLTMDVEKLESFCENECKVKGEKLVNKATEKVIVAILVVHIFGNMANMERICEIAKKYHLKVVEDATEALGTYYTQGKYKGRFAGTIGDIGVYSFNGNKIITTGGGGMIVSNNESLLKECKHLSTQAKTDELYFEHDKVGYNYRMTNIQAALGLAQLEQLEKFIETKKRNYNMYNDRGIKLISFRKDIRSNFWFYSFLSENRDGLIRYLQEKNIQTRPVWKLIHQLEPYVDAQNYKIEKAQFYYGKIVNLPCSTNLIENQIDIVANAICCFEK